jgi:hypothetical protein
MRTSHRWGVVALTVAVLAALPWAVGHRPVSAASTSAASLLDRITHSAAQPYSGYAEADGGLGLPVSGQFNSVTDLLGGHTELRVWFRSADDARVDTISAFGESDVHTDASGTWTWNYERSRATRTRAAHPEVRLPDTADVLPPELGRRLLSQARASEVQRLPVERIAGVDAIGLRLHPAQTVTSVDHVDVWADPVSGLPLRVEVYGPGTSTPAMSTAFLDFSRARPSPKAVAFVPPDRSRVDRSRGFDIASATNEFTNAEVPGTLAGLSRVPHDIGSVGVYGRGVTQLVAAPLWDGLANQLSDQLRSAGATEKGDKQSFTVGPVSALLVNSTTGRSWLFTGTVTPATLLEAAGEISADQPVRR